MTFKRSLAEACLLAEPYTNTRCARRQLAYRPRWRKGGPQGVKARKIGAGADSSAFAIESSQGFGPIQAGTAPALPLSTTKRLSVDTVAFGSRRSDMTCGRVSIRSRKRSTHT